MSRAARWWRSTNRATPSTRISAPPRASWPCHASTCSASARGGADILVEGVALFVDRPHLAARGVGEAGLQQIGRASCSATEDSDVVGLCVTGATDSLFG